MFIEARLLEFQRMTQSFDKVSVELALLRSNEGPKAATTTEELQEILWQGVAGTAGLSEA